MAPNSASIDFLDLISGLVIRTRLIPHLKLVSHQLGEPTLLVWGCETLLQQVAKACMVSKDREAPTQKIMLPLLN